MGAMFLLIFLMLCVGLASWLLFIWAVRSGQYEDVEGPKYRMLDDDDERKPRKTQKPGP
ncbi:MAG: cbb3-type cytochrome oxidase assembly protein CcoS [Spirochaetota bacterium]